MTGLMRSLVFCVLGMTIFLNGAFAASKTDLPYTKSQHWIETDGIKLQAQFYAPAGKPGPWPTIINVTGSGFEDATDDPYTHLLADTWTRAGIAVMTYNRRGGGKSGGTYSDVNFDQQAADLYAVFDYTRNMPEVDRKNMGLWGLSQAGWVMPKATAVLSHMAFLIMVSPAGVNPARQVGYYMTGEFDKLGLSKADSALASKAWDSTLLYYCTGIGHDEAQAAVDAISKKSWFAKVEKHPFWHDMATPNLIYTPEELKAEIAKRPNAFTFYTAPTTIEEFASDYRRISVPTLIIYGGHDNEVPTEESPAVFERVLKGHDATIKIFPEADHNIQISPSAVADGYRETMRDWALAHFHK